MNYTLVSNLGKAQLNIIEAKYPKIIELTKFHTMKTQDFFPISSKSASFLHWIKTKAYGLGGIGKRENQYI